MQSAFGVEHLEKSLRARVEDHSYRTNVIRGHKRGLKGEKKKPTKLTALPGFERARQGYETGHHAGSEERALLRLVRKGLPSSLKTAKLGTLVPKTVSHDKLLAHQKGKEASLRMAQYRETKGKRMGESTLRYQAGEAINAGRQARWHSQKLMGEKPGIKHVRRKTDNQVQRALGRQFSKALEEYELSKGLPRALKGYRALSEPKYMRVRRSAHKFGNKQQSTAMGYNARGRSREELERLQSVKQQRKLP